MVGVERLSVVVLTIVRNCVARAFLCLLIGYQFAGTSVLANDTVAKELVAGLDLYLSTHFDESIKRISSLLELTDLTPQDSVAVYECLSVCTYAKGKEFRQSAYSYLDSMAMVGPCAKKLPQSFWPPQLKDKWYEMMQVKDMLTCPESDDDTRKTIAFLPFDNYSATKYQESLGGISSALAEFFAYDFVSIGDMRVVEREKLEYLLKEIDLGKSGRVDKSTAVKVGRIVGARYMVFGLISQFGDKNARMGVKVVDVETSEIIATVDKEGKPNFSKMQRELVKDLATKLKIEISPDVAKSMKNRGSNSTEALEMYAKGLKYMGAYDYEAAYAQFKEAYESDKNFVAAKEKMEMYWPLVG